MKKILLYLPVMLILAAGFGCSEQRKWNREQRKEMREMLRDYRQMAYLNDLTDAEFILFSDDVATALEGDYPVYATFVTMPGVEDTVQLVIVPIWMGGKINAANRAARINEKTAVAQGNQTRNALISELVERYFGLALATQVVAVRQQVVDGVRRHLEDARALERNGMIAQTERLYVEFKMAEAERELANAKLQAETIASALSNTLGRESDWRPVTAMFLLAKVEDLAYYQDLAQARNPLLSQVSLKRELAQEGVRAQRADFLPQVAAIGGGSFYNYQVAGLVPRWAVGVGVNIKIFDGLNREYKYSAAKQTVRRVGELQNKAGKDIAVLVEKLYNQMMNYRNQMTSIDASLKFAEEYLRMKNAAFLEGMSSSSDLIDAELNLAGVRTERLQAAYNYDLLLARLLEAAGISDEYPSYARRNDAQAVLFDGSRSGN